MATSPMTFALASLLAAPSLSLAPAPSEASPAEASPIAATTIDPSAIQARLRSPRDLPRAPSDRFKAKRLGRKDLRGARTAVAVGGALFGVFYLGGTLAAATTLDDIHEDGQITPDERDQQRVSRLMFVPVIGPLVASPMGESKGETASLVAHGLFQGFAAAALIGGSIALARDRRARRLALSAGWSATGVSVGLRGRF